MYPYYVFLYSTLVGIMTCESTRESGCYISGIKWVGLFLMFLNSLDKIILKEEINLALLIHFFLITPILYEKEHLCC